MEVARLKVSGTYARVIMRDIITAGMAGVTIAVEYVPGIWDGLTKTVVFKSTVTKDVITNNTVIEIPPEVLTDVHSHLQIGVYGIDAAEKVVIPTIWADLGVIQPGADPSGDPGTDPELPIWAQLADRVEDIAKDVEELQQTGGVGPGTPGAPGADGEDGGYYTRAVTQLDEDTVQFEFTPSKPDMPAVNPVTVELPAGQGSGGNVELDTTLTQSGKAADAKAVGDKIAEITGISLVEPAEDDIPKIFFGGALQQTKDEKVVPFRYISKTEEIIGFAEIKAQGNSSMSYPKKNQTVKMFADEACESKMKKDFKGWGKQNKHVYKANWIDITHSRNVVSARLWGDVVKTRANYLELPELLRTSPNQGAVDGFPVKVYAAGVYQGRYTLNIPKDAWMANMDDELDEHCILCGENYVSGCFRAAANINGGDWSDEVHDVVPASIKTRWNQVISFVMNSTDDEFRANLSQYFYVDSLIDYYLFGLASCGLDAFGKNQLYMTYDGQKWIATMYDMDSTWGLWWTGQSFVATDYDRSEYQDFADGGEGNLLYIRLENLFYEELKARWAELRSGALSIENIINRFERFTDITPDELVKEDYASTTADGKFTNIPSKTTSTIQQIRAYAVARHAWCDTYVAGLTGGGEVEPDEPDAPDVPETIPCTGITLDKTELTFDGEGTQTITATVTPIDTTDSFVWISSTPAVASISVDGNVCTVHSAGNGKAVITVTCGEHSASCSVSVSGITEPEIDYTLNPLAGVTWSVGLYDNNTGEPKTATNEYCTEKFSLQNCVYNFQNGSGNTWGAIWMWDENGDYVGCTAVDSGTKSIGKFAAKSGWKYAIKVANTSGFDASTVSLMPVDQSANATSRVTLDSAALAWRDTQYGTETDITSVINKIGINSVNTIKNNVNSCSHIMFLDSAVGSRINRVGSKPMLYMQYYGGSVLLIAADVSATDVSALVGTVTIN